MKTRTRTKVTMKSNFANNSTILWSLQSMLIIEQDFYFGQVSQICGSETLKVKLEEDDDNEEDVFDDMGDDNEDVCFEPVKRICGSPDPPTPARSHTLRVGVTVTARVA